MRALRAVVLALVFASYSVIHCYDYKVAVCITGQPGRLFVQPMLNMTGSNPNIYFHFFYFLQEGTYSNESNAPIYNTDEWQVYSPSPFFHLSRQDIESEIRRLYSTSTNTLVTVWHNEVTSKQRWMEIFQVTRLNLVEQYEERQHTILNMYSHQVACMRHIQSVEQQSASSSSAAVHFDYVVNSREDTYFYHSLNLTDLIMDRFRNAISRHAHGSSAHAGCGMLHRSCLTWSGVNMRLQIYSRPSADIILTNRLIFYNESLHNLSDKDYFLNPEVFELRQLKFYGVMDCPVPVSFLPVSVVRHTFNGSFCLPRFETMHRCHPRGSTEFVVANRCK